MEKNRIVIYHADCVDGFSAAWVAWLKFGGAAEYIPAHYGDAPPDVTGKEVLIVDFSYPRETLLGMAEQAKTVTLLDHHKTAQQDLEPLLSGAVASPPNLEVLFDQSRSGAGIAWDELHPGQRPKLVDYVEDRDLWRWKLPDSKEVSAYIASLTRDFEHWTRLRRALEQDFLNVAAAGSAVLRVQQNYISALARNAGQALIGGYLVPFVNVPLFQSELLGELADGFSFACGWFQRSDGKFVYSLRSRGGFDCSTVAKQFGGGGHPGAAGFTLDHLIPMEANHDDA